MLAARLTEPRHFSNVGRGTFRSKIYLPVITPWQRRFPGVSRPVTFVYVLVSLCLFRLLSLRALRASLRERGRVRIIMALRVLTLHLLSQLVIHVFSPRSVPTRRFLFFSPRIRPSRISYIVIRSLCCIYRTSGEGIASTIEKSS